MSLKIYIIIEEEGFPALKSKIQVPKSWAEREVGDVMKLFADGYNKKNPDTPIDISRVHFETKDGGKVFTNDKVSAGLEDLEDYYIKHGVHLREQRTEAIDKDCLRCKNYGCNQYYKPAENGDSACCHHTGPPVFHDTAKYWSCCAGRKAYDFESFQLISGCATGCHSDTPPQISISASPNAPVLREGVSEGSSTSSGALKSIADFNTSNPTAVSAASSAMKTVERKSTRNADGTARCQRRGCGKVFAVAAAGPTDCCYHAGQPIFHDAVKFWSCCADRKCYDFDEFLQVPGCASGAHDDGVVDL